MLPRERVIEVIRHRKPDRVPLYGWVYYNLEKPITARHGSVAAFEDKFEFDYAHLFGGPACYSEEDLNQLRQARGEITPDVLLDLPIKDPNDMDAYREVIEGVRHHKEQRGRFVYLQTPGLFEACNFCFGIENHLAYLLMYEDSLREVYRRQAEWNRAFAMNGLDLGVDMIHVSDDWGSQNSLLFSPDVWRRMIRPYHKITCDAVKSRGGFLSLHCDGNFRAVLDDVIELGYDVVHPFQESAGMDLVEFRDKYRDRLTVMGGLCIQTTLGFGKLDFLEKEIRRVLGMFRDGGLLYCTSHFVQDHCSMDELEFAFSTARRLAGEQAKI